MRWASISRSSRMTVWPVRLVIGHSLPNAQGGLDMHIAVAMSELQRADVMQQVAGIVHRMVLAKEAAGQKGQACRTSP